LFQSKPYEAPSSAVLGAGAGGVSAAESPAPPPSSPAELGANGRSVSGFFDKFFKESYYGKRTGMIPVKLSFPAFGPSLFLVSELTSEGQTPTLALSYEKNKKGGAR